MVGRLNRRTFLRSTCLLTLGFSALALVPAIGQGTAPEGLTVIGNGQNAVIVTPDNPTQVVRYAAQELVYHLEKATGKQLLIVTEGAVPANVTQRIYLGDTRAARAAGLDVQALAPETFVLRTRANALYIAGNDSPGDPLEMSTAAGTLFGVYEWLERDLGVRWVWPGELGTFVPKAQTIRAKRVDATITPRFFQRNVRGGLTFKSSEHPSLGFTPDAAENYAKAQNVFLRRNRMGKGERISYGHAFTDWWAKYGAEHPEWFQLVDGKRGPTRPGGSYSMCVSNPEFQRKIVDLWKETRASKPSNGPSYLNAVENGIMGLCECENCKALDGPQPPDYQTYYSPKGKVYGARFVTDRYAKYWLAVHKEAAKIDPNVTVIAYNYFNYFHTPSPEIKLNKNILVGSYPSSGWFPRSTEEQQWFKNQWQGWHATGARLFSRGNYCLDGYNMPLIFAHQFTEEFHAQVRSGMEATDYDALTGHWSTQGPNIYVMMRLQTRPDASADELLAEYYSAFGPAGPGVKAYFDYWERYALENRARINQIFDDTDSSRWRSWARVAHLIFPETAFAPAEALLAKAATAAAADAEALARVEFLQKGLTHARLCVRAGSLLTQADPASTPERGEKALDELIAFRRANEQNLIANFNHAAWVEEGSWKLPDETKPTPVAVANVPNA